ncbi:MAG: hypothetical protein M4579_003313 [Chaenotheca gracillima]|nr:MAG: hypothetical protein M4579_003313 [Chaenotheca gracillima]
MADRGLAHKLQKAEKEKYRSNARENSLPNLTVVRDEIYLWSDINQFEMMTWTAVAPHEARQVIVTPGNRGPQINVVAWTTMVIMVLAVGTRLTIKFNSFRRFAIDDAFVALAMLAAVGQAVAVSMQVANGGLGQHMPSLQDDEIRSFEQGQYASDLLYIATLCFSKLTSLMFIVHLTPDKQHRRWSAGIIVAIIIWALIALFGISFACELPYPWAILALWGAIGTLDIVTDLTLVALPAYILWHVQMPPSRKGIVCIAFASRIILIPLIILRLVFLSSAISSSDKTFDYRDTVFTSLADANASILVACIPFLKPFMNSLDSGLLTSDLRVRGTKSTMFSHGVSVKASGTGGGSGSNERHMLQKVFSKPGLDRSNSRGSINGFAHLRDDGARHQVTIAHDPPQHDFESRTSAGSDQMIIKRTTEVNVNYDEAERSRGWPQ